MVAHGGPDYGDDYWHIHQRWLWFWILRGMIYPSEIRNLWYHSYNPITDEEIDVNPWDTIVLSDSCHGFYVSSNSMAHAWVDYGAEAYVGAIISIPILDNDEYIGAFWERLCQGDGTVRQATIDLCNEHGGGWNLGDEWRILGNQYATLP